MLKANDHNTLRDRLKELKETIEHLLESNISNVLVMAGSVQGLGFSFSHSEDEFERGCILY
jgi:flagellar biosynthesis/type III secretory pathway chaperone